MAGNVWEWVEDTYHDSYDGAPTDGSTWGGEDPARVFRGGGWTDDASLLRAAVRGRGSPGSRGVNLGFRVAFPAPPGR